jgi:hypothetical protein
MAAPRVARRAKCSGLGRTRTCNQTVVSGAKAQEWPGRILQSGANHPIPQTDYDLVPVGHCNTGPAERGPAVPVNRPRPQRGPLSDHGWREQLHGADAPGLMWRRWQMHTGKSKGSEPDPIAW